MRYTWEDMNILQLFVSVPNIDQMCASEDSGRSSKQQMFRIVIKRCLIYRPCYYHYSTYRPTFCQFVLYSQWSSLRLSLYFIQTSTMCVSSSVCPNFLVKPSTEWHNDKSSHSVPTWLHGGIALQVSNWFTFSLVKKCSTSLRTASLVQRDILTFIESYMVRFPLSSGILNTANNLCL